ncbi:immune inhibitor A domain-containing protein [Actinopolymorpha alba]|uniref:immune inhibitor A domain-containing protein n=1 Tax=Actinopolymorpha alba TaxID=533267 RepID=UPI00037FB722|nr:immune inhibitor A domain-containing protein [Actinopolymorpha alba]
MRLRKATATAVTVAAIAALAATAAGIPASAAPPAGDVPPARTHAPDDLPNRHGDKLRETRKAALEKVLRGEAKVERRGKSDVVRVGKNEFAQLSMEKTDKIFTILTEFGDQTDPRTGGAPGPVRNQIAEPNRQRDNTTYWTDNFDRQHYLDLFFGQDGESMSTFYRAQSQGRYTVAGDVSEWVTVPFNEARYGSNNIADDDGYWNYVKDTTEAWYADQKAQGKTTEQIKAYLAQFDTWDRYDYDGDGNFDEPDGYIDHFQAVHAGEGEEAGGGAQGADAIWSHRWYAFPDAKGGPDVNPRGGVPIGDTGLWVGDYTTEPENGGLGVFAHEYGHDLGLPDLYDTAGGENGTGFWTLMSSGSWLGHGDDSIGTTPGFMGAWEKLQLGWLDYEVVSPDRRSTTVLGPAAESTANPQALVVPLPKEQVVTEYNTPYSGAYEWWGGSADGLNTMLKRTIDLTGKTSAALTSKVWYDIEEGYDFLHAEVSTDGGVRWTSIGTPLTGSSGGKWTDLSYDLSAYAGQKIVFRFRYATDGGLHLAGPMLDDIGVAADGASIFFDDVEGGTNGWTTSGWTRFGGTSMEYKGTYYLAENRQYVGYDSTLQTGPYNFNRPITKPDWVQHYPYQNGLLVTYWNEKQENNNTSRHPGEGLILPVDARPGVIRYDNGTLANLRAHAFDATFGLERTDAITLSREARKGKQVQVIMADVPAQKAIPVFDDSKPNAYWNAANPNNSVKVAGYGVKIGVTKQSADKRQLTVVVQPAR